MGPFRVSHSEKMRVKIKVLLDLHGMVTIDSASVSIVEILHMFLVRAFQPFGS